MHVRAFNYSVGMGDSEVIIENNLERLLLTTKKVNIINILKIITIMSRKIMCASMKILAKMQSLKKL